MFRAEHSYSNRRLVTALRVRLPPFPIGSLAHALARPAGCHRLLTVPSSDGTASNRRFGWAHLCLRAPTLASGSRHCSHYAKLGYALVSPESWKNLKNPGGVLL
jgi:hypothetical protein